MELSKSCGVKVISGKKKKEKRDGGEGIKDLDSWEKKKKKYLKRGGGTGLKRRGYRNIAL